jgi:hypothetical protein
LTQLIKVIIEIRNPPILQLFHYWWLFDVPRYEQANQDSKNDTHLNLLQGYTLLLLLSNERAACQKLSGKRLCCWLNILRPA